MYYFFFLMIPHCKVEDCPLTDLILDGCFKQLFSYKGFHYKWRIALNQDAVIDSTPRVLECL